MTNILVPLDTRNSLQLRAAYFALEFAKRTGAKVLFLTIQLGGTPGGSDGLDRARDGEFEQDLDRLINDSLIAGLQIESYVTTGDYIERVIEFAEHHNVSRVILALPEADEPGRAEAASRLDALQRNLTCGLVTVRPRHEAQGFSRMAQ